MAPFEAFVASLFLIDDINEGLALDNARRLAGICENAARALAYCAAAAAEMRDEPQQ